MVWQPAGFTDGSCNNQIAPLTLTCFLVHYFSSSNDEILRDVYGDQNVIETNYDFIVVGAGASGSVVASRLSETLNWKVLLLEAGDEEPRICSVPGQQNILSNTNIDYSYHTNDSRPSIYNRGKVMGGSTAINGMVYARGSKADYDDWANSGNEGWDWNNVLPYFKKSENMRIPEILSKYAEYHGTTGYLSIDEFPEKNRITPIIIKAYEEAGLRSGIDYNQGDQIGISQIQTTSLHGTRMSTNDAFIRPFRQKRPNLVVRPNSRVTRIIIDTKTNRATGVEYETKKGNNTATLQVFAKNEVILSAGSIDSPRLLMLSGIGPKADLEKLKIPVIKDLPVGQNLQDHFFVNLLLLTNSSRIQITEETIKGDLFEWINTHEGPQSARPIVQIEAFYQTKFENKSGAADIQYEVFGYLQADNTPSDVSINTILLDSKSKGSIKLNDIDPLNYQPEIKLNPLVSAEDVDVLVEGLKFARSVANNLKSIGLSLSPVPHLGCENIDINSDDYLRCLIKNTFGNYGHAVSTCKMGPETDNDAVVDSSLKVRGISGLRVIDASIMPKVTRGNIMAPTIMIGEKGSDLIKKDYL